MTTTTQKLIKIGSSWGVTIPAKEVKKNGWDSNTVLNVSLEEAPVEATKEQVALVTLTQKLIARHQKALKNLSQR